MAKRPDSSASVLDPEPKAILQDPVLPAPIKPLQTKKSSVITFRLSKHVDGPFPGLWELVVLKTDGTIDEVISDADMLQYCLDNLHQSLENRGF